MGDKVSVVVEVYVDGFLHNDVREIVRWKLALSKEGKHRCSLTR